MFFPLDQTIGVFWYLHHRRNQAHRSRAGHGQLFHNRVREELPTTRKLIGSVNARLAA